MSRALNIGLDFDNTIACYEGVFHAAAFERGMVPADLATDKTSVRNFLRASGREDDWTELQGHVYGARMDLVRPYPGVAEFIRAARGAGHSVAIISHKTKHPFLGPRHDLHAAARGFLQAHGLLADAAVDPANAHFELTLAGKLGRIADLGCDLFVDDLPEFLAEADFPPATRAILFDPDGHYPGGAWQGRAYERHRSWKDIHGAVLGN